MLQNTRNQQSNSQGHPGRGSNDTQESKNYEGFEGMNYEQRRQPYDPQHIGNYSSNDSNNGTERHDEL